MITERFEYYSTSERCAIYTDIKTRTSKFYIREWRLPAWRPQFIDVTVITEPDEFRLINEIVGIQSDNGDKIVRKAYFTQDNHNQTVRYDLKRELLIEDRFGKKFHEKKLPFHTIYIPSYMLGNRMPDEIKIAVEWVIPDED